ncbi:MerR family transcriptional regulator [Clostridium lacusfryxellense]|uniref:MerR family transcriptional regulator n=1 Tax=Clostridium lacusfryxellense TaxID=205328 RepID=UPI001C0D8408|nr:MerR family transcriptional regulator [Clostridium lacusfryxellense]MBU3114535.1 MerR family transcriptional regulator [Clostridium lacusfryxellense]
MLIKCVCKECMLTKKSIEYYEKKGLIRPEIGKNNYRNYNDNDIAVLKEISVLRKIGIHISDIKIILESNNKVAALSKCKCLMELKLQKTKAQYNCIEHLITNYDIDKEIEYINDNVNDFFTIKEKLLQSFPGTYGMYLCIHFGQFLNEKIDSEEKENAYYNVVNFLDSVDNLNFSSELEEYLENCFSVMQKTDMVKMNNAMLKAVDNMDDYIENNKEILEEYIKIRTSDDYKLTSAYKMQQLLLDFQQSSGYYDIFLSNLKILSFSYFEYTEKLQVANKVFLNKYPQTQDINK